MISFIKSAKTKKDFPDSLKEVVFVGRSNVGKSSLINALYKNKLAYVGKTPGKTRLINFFNINDEYTAVDVPGYGYAKVSQKEREMYSNKILEESLINAAELIKRQAPKLADEVMEENITNIYITINCEPNEVVTMEIDKTYVCN